VRYRSDRQIKNDLNPKNQNSNHPFRGGDKFIMKKFASLSLAAALATSIMVPAVSFAADATPTATPAASASASASAAVSASATATATAAPTLTLEQKFKALQDAKILSGLPGEDPIGADKQLTRAEFSKAIVGLLGLVEDKAEAKKIR